MSAQLPWQLPKIRYPGTSREVTICAANIYGWVREWASGVAMWRVSRDDCDECGDPKVMSGTVGTFDGALVDADAAFRRFAAESIAEYEESIAELREVLS